MTAQNRRVFRPEPDFASPVGLAVADVQPPHTPEISPAGPDSRHMLLAVTAVASVALLVLDTLIDRIRQQD